jgi:serine protease AprX
VRSSFSSVGPTTDGRIKPDLMARGGQAIVCLTSGAFSNANGTSFACPILAGAAACFWQKHPNLSNFKVMDTLKKMASNALSPNNLMGWGIPDMCKVLSINEPQGANQPQVIIVPNPSVGIFKISLPNGLNATAELKVYDVVGKIILETKLNNTQTRYDADLRMQTNGIYFLQVKYNQTQHIFKLIKQ